MEEIDRVVLTAGGKKIATLAEMQRYSYSIGESNTSPPVITRMIAGEDVDPAALYAALDRPGRDAVFPEDAGLEVVELLLSRLRAAFPDLGPR